MAFVFDTQKLIIMQKTLNNLWLRQTVTADNIANKDTPGFKAKRVMFEDVLQNIKVNNLPAKGDIPNARVEEDSNTSLMENGNNVDIDRENLIMLRTQLQYEAMIRQLSSEFSKIRTAISGGRG